MVLVFETIEHCLRRHVFEYSLTCGVFDDRALVMQGEDQSAEGARSDPAEALRALDTDAGV